jgi:hypothetical protein
MKGYLPHFLHRGREQSITRSGNRHSKKRRWVVERTNSWHNMFRKLFCISMFELLYPYLQGDNLGYALGQLFRSFYSVRCIDASEFE